MKVVDNRIKTLPFNLIKVGQCFEHNGAICLKIGISETEPNTFDYTHNLLLYIRYNYDVVPLETELVVHK